MADDDESETNCPAPAPPDRFADAIALCQIAKNKTVATQLKKLRRVNRQIADAEAKVIAVRITTYSSLRCAATFRQVQHQMIAVSPAAGLSMSRRGAWLSIGRPGLLRENGPLDPTPHVYGGDPKAPNTYGNVPVGKRR